MSGSYSSGDSSVDDTRGEFKWTEGHYIRERFCIHKELGKGTFGLVLECWDKKRSRIVAVKVVRAIKRYIESAETEARILTRVNDTANHERPTHVIEMFKCFEWHGHFCIVSEKLGASLLQVLEENEYQPFEMFVIRDVARQLLQALKFLHEECRLVHTDLKLENILLVDSRTEPQAVPSSPERVHTVRWAPYLRLVRTEIKVIDFGGATFDWMHKAAVINTRQYRGPEVILDTGWSFPSDLWSAGCVLMELYLGDLLFKAHAEDEHLAMMERTCGAFPAFMTADERYFRHDGKVRWPDRADDNIRVRCRRRAAKRATDAPAPRTWRDCKMLSLPRTTSSSS